jgi:anhydro-N-acetylmuramic acid kinase
LQILEKLNEIDFYKKSHPKSLGIEWVKAEIFPLLQKETPENILATFTEHVAIQISKTFNEFNLKKLLVTGGGAFNSYLIEKLKIKSSAEIIIPEANIINFKEALIFAFMGVLRIRNEVNVLCSATGSSKNHSSGIIA